MSLIRQGRVFDDDLFHTVTMTEETSWKQGYTEGAEEGRVRGFVEGFALGAQKGTDIGKEVGFYAGFSGYLIRLQQTKHPQSRIVKVCETIMKLANTFENMEPTDEALTDNLSQIRGKFKQLSSLIGIQVQYTSALSDSVKGTSF